MPNGLGWRYARLVTGKRYCYSVCEAGWVIRTLNTGFKETRVKPFLDRGRLIVSFNNGKRHVLKSLVAKHFLPDYQPGWPIEPIDGNEHNCAVWNLKQYSPEEHMKRYRDKLRSRPITINGVWYPTITEAAKSIPIDRSTLYDYIRDPEIATRGGIFVKMF